MLGADNAVLCYCNQHESSKNTSKFCSSGAAIGTTAPDFFSNSLTQANFVWSTHLQNYKRLSPHSILCLEDTCPIYNNVKVNNFDTRNREPGMPIGAHISRIRLRKPRYKSACSNLWRSDWTKNLAIQVERYASWKLCIRQSIDGIG